MATDSPGLEWLGGTGLGLTLLVGLAVGVGVGLFASLKALRLDAANRPPATNAQSIRSLRLVNAFIVCCPLSFWLELRTEKTLVESWAEVLRLTGHWDAGSGQLVLEELVDLEYLN
jgi:uncharacterized protein YneF (UPF0154 family)